MTFDNASPWALSLLGTRRTMGDDGQCGALWRYDDTRDGVAALWTYWSNGKARTQTGTFGRNPGSVSHSFPRTYAMKRESSRVSYLALAGRELLVGGPRGEMR